LKAKKTPYLLVAGFLILVSVLAACGRTTMPGDRIKVVPHSVGWGFTNCLVCHSGKLAPPSAFHPTNPTVEQCLTPGCHAEGTITPTTPPPTTTTTPPTSTTTPPTTTPESPGPISYENHFPYTDASTCFICHTGLAPVLANPADHADYANDSCLDPGCHELPVAP
jgi:hypothetical protein